MTHFTRPAADPVDHTSTPGPDTPSVPSCFSAPQSPDELGQLGRYRILSRLGAGGMGAVYLAFDTGLERTVALKIMLRQHATNVQARERFLREARAAAMVRSDNVVTIFDVGESEGTPFIAMEHLRGYPLDEYLKKKGEVNLGQAMRVARETAVGLEAAHKLGLVHRDIKPANLWLEAPKGRLKILDFGLARKDVADTDLTLTQEGQMLGSPAFMSPEQGRGEKVDHRSDLFSLGVVLFRLVTGRMPFEGKTIMALMTSLATHIPNDVRSYNPEIPESLADAIGRLLEKNPAHRFSSAGELVKALDGAMPSRRAVEPVVIRVEPLPEVTVPIVHQVWDGIDDMDMTLSETIVAPRPEPTKRRMPPLAWVAIALGALLPILLLAIVLIKTPKGTLVIESDDPDVEVVVKQNGAIIRDKTKQREIELNVGDFTIELAEKKEGLKLTTNAFEISKNGRTSVRVRLEKPTAVAAKGNEAIVPKAVPTAKDAATREAIAWLLSHKPNRLDVKTTDGRTIIVAKLDDVPAGAAIVFVEQLGEQNSIADAELKKYIAGLVDLEGFCVGRSSLRDESMELLASLPKLAQLSLWDDRITDRGMKAIGGMKRLQGLMLGGLSEPGITEIGMAELIRLKALQSLKIDGFALQEDLFRPIGRMTQLTSLHVTNQQPGYPFSGKVIGSWKGLTSLTSLELAAIDLDDCAFEGLAKILTLERLLLHRTKLTGKGISQLAVLPRLDSINLENSLFSDEGCKEIARLSQLNQLWLSRTLITDVGVEALAESGSIWQLDISHDRVTDKVAGSLAKMKILRVLRLAGIPFSDGGMKILSQSTTLTAAGFDTGEFSDAGVKHFVGKPLFTELAFMTPNITDASVADLCTMTQLTWLDVTGSRISAAGLASLRKALPKANILPQVAVVVPAPLPPLDAARDAQERKSFEWLIKIKAYRIGLRDRTGRGFESGNPKDFQPGTVLTFVETRNNPAISDATFDEYIAPLADLEIIDIGQPLQWTRKGFGSVAKLRRLKKLVMDESRKFDDDDCATVSQLPALEEVHGSGAAFTPAGAELLSKLSNLHTFSLGNGTIADESVVPLMKLPNLQNLNLSGCPGITGEFLAAGGPKLTSLILNGTGFTDASFRHLKLCPNLESISAEVTKVDGSGFVHLDTLQNLTSLDFHGCQVSDVDGLATVAKLPKLTSLTLHVCPVSDAGVEAIARSQSITNLDLIGSKITDEGAKILGGMKSLQTLRVSRTGLTDKGAAGLALSSSLTSLSIGGPSIGDAAVSAIAGRKKPWQELWFDVSPMITDASVPKLAEFKSLQILGVADTSITPAGLSKLRKALKGTKIYPE